jgi:ADP-sugar diphosphatase
LFGKAPKQRLGFLKLTSKITNGANESLPGIVFLRGPSVAMLVVLTPDDASDETEQYAILTVQPRAAAGSLEFVEIPAGMVDEAGKFAGTAAKEVKEELGLEITEDELKCLSELAAEEEDESAEGLPTAMFPSPGGCDESIRIFLHERTVPRSQLDEWTGKLTGLREDGEKITLKLVPVKDLWKVGARDGKTLAAVTLWEGLKREGRLR